MLELVLRFMSWEEDGVYEEACPCGKGKIITRYYSDDWNRTESINEIVCDYCREHYTFIEYQHKYETRTALVTVEEARERKLRKLAEEERRRAELQAKYHEEYEKNLISFNRSVKIASKKYPLYVISGGMYIDSKMFFGLPRNVQEVALGSARGRSPYCLEALSCVSRQYWTTPPSITTEHDTG